MQLIGSPSDADLGFLRSDNARRYVRQLPHYDRQPLSVKFPQINAEAIDLIDKMLLFDPARRITGKRFWI
jgi:mitogen-activated protein kinase 1/3